MMVIQSKVTVAILFIAGMFCLLPQPTAVAVIPNSDNPDAYTEKQFRQELLEYNRKTMSEAYLKAGKRDPKWDGLAVELLDAQAEVFANGGADARSRVPVTSSRERILELTAMTADLGCTDPLVSYVRLINSKEQDERYLELAKEIYTGMLESDYPINRKLAIARRMVNILDKRGLEEESGEAAEVWIDLFCQAISDPGFGLRDQYFLFRNYMEPPDDKWMARWDEVCKRIDVEDAPNPWLVGALCGNYHVKLAWKKRGGGYAHTVSDEGWKGFNEHLKTAREHLVRAWETAPQYPDVPSKLIRVSMGLDNGEERLWFERAVGAQFDYYGAYTSYLWSIRPRWGGSLDQMYAFGVECLDTGRFDTRVPEIFYKAMLDLYSETDDYSYWLRPGVYESFITYYEGKKHAPGGEEYQAWWDSMKAAIAWRLQKYDLAAQQMEQLGDAFIPRTFSKLGGEPPLAVSEVYLRLDPITGAAADRADKLWDQKRYRRAAELLDVTLLNLAPDDPARAFLENKAAQSRWKHRDQQGVWADLLGRTDMGGWDVERGQWSMDERGRLTGHSLDNGLAVVCRLKFGYRYELKGSLECLKAPDPQEINGGVLMVYQVKGSRAYHRDVLLFPQKQSVLAARTFKYATESFPAELNPKNTFHLQVWDRHVRLSVNGKVVIEHRQMPRKLSSTVYRFALGGYYDQPGASIRYDELKIRRLRSRPDWADSPTQTADTTARPE
jgi:hypothetical protein